MIKSNHAKEGLAEYSKSRVLAWTLGPFILLAILWLLIGSRPASEVFSVENLMRSTPWRPVPVIAVGVMVVWIGINALLIGAAFLNRDYVSSDGSSLFVGFMKKTPLRELRVAEATVKSGWSGDRIQIPKTNGDPLLIRTDLSKTNGARLLARIASVVDAEGQSQNTS